MIWKIFEMPFGFSSIGKLVHDWCMCLVARHFDTLDVEVVISGGAAGNLVASVACVMCVCV